MTGKSKCIAHRPNWLPSDFGAAKVVVRISVEYGIVFPCWVGVLAAPLSVQVSPSFSSVSAFPPVELTRRQHPSYQLPQQAH